VNRAPFEPRLTFMARLRQRADLSALAAQPRGTERKQEAFERLIATAEASQKPLLEAVDELAKAGKVSRIERLYSPNMVVVSAASEADVDGVLAALRGSEAVAAVYRATDGSLLDPAAKADAVLGQRNLDPDAADGLDVATEGEPTPSPPPAEPWSLRSLKAPEAWAQGATGAGLVFGSIDTGVDGTHPALKPSYRGRAAGAPIEHDYNWFDFGDKPSATPKDYRWHGTHTMGSVVGRSPAGTFGVAPDAKWIGVAGMTPQSNDVLNLLRAVQWMQAPTQRDGTGPRPDAAPDVVGMSWRTAPAHQDLFQQSIQNLAAAGIVPVKSAGNGGPGPETTTSPGQFQEIIAITAIDQNDDVATFASRGPSAFHAPGARPHFKPDLGAPGVDIRSSVPGGQYATWSGTSMAQPHASGAILGLLSKYPQLNDIQLRAAMEYGARDSGSPGRDLETGAGVVDMAKALRAAQAILAGKVPEGPGPDLYPGRHGDVT